MKKWVAMGFLGCLVAVSSGVLAQEKTDGHAGHHPADAAAAPATATQEAAAMSQQRMQDNMKKMHGLMEKTHAAKSPEEKQRLLEQHHGAMHEQMKMMNGMKGGDGKMPMMGGKGGPGGKGGMGEKGGMMDGEMMKHHQAMMHRMDMMQDMMGQMMEHMSAEHHMMKPEPIKK